MKKPTSIDETVAKFSPSDMHILNEIKRLNLTEEEAKQYIRQLKIPKKEVGNRVSRNYGRKHIKYGVMSDPHIGHNNFREDVFDDSRKMFTKEAVDEILIPGDIIEGMSNRDGHIYELSIPGVSGQLDRAIELLNTYKQPKIAILGNHDLWSVKKANQGVHPRPYLEKGVKDLTIIGDMSGDIDLGDIVIRLTHEGNTAYALSYSLQKRINALSGGDKPNVMLNGHLHKGIYMFYRNIHAFEAYCLQDQTDFMKMKGSPAHVGYMILDITYNKSGITELKPTFFPYY